MIQAAYNLNNELRVLSISAPVECQRDSCSFVTVSSPAVIVDAMKQVLVVVSAECLTFSTKLFSWFVGVFLAAVYEIYYGT